MHALFWQNLHFQIAAICIMTVLVFDYFRRKRLNIAQTRCFSTLLALAVLNLALDVATVYTISHPEVPAWLNRLCHQLFIGSMNSLSYCLFLYVTVLTRTQRRISRRFLLLLSIPYAVSMLMVVFCPLHYHVDEQHVYSFGPMAYSIFICVTIYLVIIDVYIAHYRKLFTTRKRVTIAIATAIWIVVAIVQYLKPHLLLSSLGISLMLMYIYLAFQSPGEYLDHDAGCFNRRAFRSILREQYDAQRPTWVMNLVLSDLPQLNLRYGNRTGQQLLRQISAYLQGLFGDAVFHYRGNSLAAVSHNQAKFDAAMQKLEERFTQPWAVDALRFQPAYHADVVYCPQYAKTADEVFELLDYLFGREPDDESSPHICTVCEAAAARKERALLVQQVVEQAIHSDGLSVVYQPIWNVKDGGFTSAEALVRLKDTTTAGFVGPDEFIPIAERNGWIVELGEKVLEQVCRFCAQNKPWEKGVHYIEVNLSGLQMDDPELADRLLTILRHYNIAPSFINFEVTESVAVASGEAFMRNMKALRAAGASFSLDDFGTGYSNLARVAQSHYDLIKFDKSLIWPCFGESPQSPAIVLESMANMAGALMLPIVAEGVETGEQSALLKKLGISYMQGYLYSKPLPAEGYADFLSKPPSAPM